MNAAGNLTGRGGRPARRKRRDLRRARRRIHTSENAFRFLRVALGIPMDWFFRVKAHNTELFHEVKPPFVILSNHACFLDPFFLGRFVPRAVHYVVSDSNFRSRLVDWGLHVVGGIPKTKALSDLDTVKHIVQIKARKGVIGIFPEGQSSWDGHSLPIYYSTAKLLKSLKVPVVTTKIEGSFLSMPRWGRGPRRGRVDVHFKLGLSGQDLRRMTVDEIYESIVRLLDHDEFDAQKRRRVRFAGTNRAQYMEVVLFICPECRSLNTLESRGNRIVCSNCGYAAHVNGYGFFDPVSGPLHFPDLRRWNLWQVQYFESLLDTALQEQQETPILVEDHVRIREGFKSQPLEFRGLGRMSLTIDRLSLDASFGKGRSYSFEVRDIEGINVQNGEFLEFYYRGSLYQVTIVTRGGNSYKWNLAVRHLQGHAKQTLKRESTVL